MELMKLKNYLEIKKLVNCCRNDGWECLVTKDKERYKMFLKKLSPAKEEFEVAVLFKTAKEAAEEIKKVYDDFDIWEHMSVYSYLDADTLRDNYSLYSSESCHDYSFEQYLRDLGANTNVHHRDITFSQLYIDCMMIKRMLGCLSEMVC